MKGLIKEIMLRLVCLFFCVFWMFSSSLSLAKEEDSSSSFYFNHTTKKAYNELLKLKIGKSSELLLTLDGTRNINGISLYLQNCHDIIRLLVTEDESLYEELEEKSKERMKLLKALDESSPYYLFIQAEVQIQWAAVKMKFGKRLAGLNDGASAYNLLKKNEELFPDFIPNKKTLGACKVMIGSLPKQSKKWASLFGYKGDVKEGMADLQEVIDSDTPFALEAKMMKGFITAYVLGKHEDALVLFQELALQHPDSQLLYFATAIAAKQAGKSSLALKMLEKAPKGEDYCDFYFLDYLKAEACLLTGEYFKSIMYSKSFIQRFKGKNYIKDAYLKLFLAHWFLNDSRAEKYLELAKSNGNNLVVPDIYAEKFIAAGYLPNKTVTKARFFHDGGDYKKAVDILSRVDQETLVEKRDQIEYIYRKARSLQMLKRYEEAIVLYKQVLAICPKDFPHYFGGNAALQLGVVYWEVHQDRSSAVFYLKEVPSYEGHEYEDGLNSKAKVMLAMLQ